MASMTRAHDEVLDATAHLPDGATLIVPRFDWDDYERLLEDLADRPRLRVSYDCGRLEIVSPLPEHEKYARFIDDVVRAFADAYGLEVEKLGHTTWKRRALAKGVEADACYYIRNAQRVIGKRTIDLDSDPPPDIAVEIDTTTDSSKKFRIFAALAIPELWTYDGHAVVMYQRDEAADYTVTPSSRFLRGLTGPMLAEALESSKTHGQTKALSEFRRKIRSLKRRSRR
jgi:Uma2 family endonuclease